MDTVKFQKLDRRYRGFPEFRWMMEVSRRGDWGHRISEFSEMRRWCWENFGPSDEFDVWCYVKSDLRNNDWAWDFIKGKMRIYINEKLYSWAILKWQQ